MAEFDSDGPEAFLDKYHFGRRVHFYVEYDGRFYHAKAIANVAYRKQFPHRDERVFSGGEDESNKILRHLGFTVLEQPNSEAGGLRRFGEIPDVPPGTTFPNRRHLFDAGVHRQLQAGIAGTPAQGAESIVLSGGYEDDADYGDEIVYTGQGGQAGGRQVADQELTRGNAALVTSIATGKTVRVTRGAEHKSPYSPAAGYRYDGLFVVEDYWSERGRSGFLVWRYRMTSAATPAPSSRQPLAAPQGNAAPGRATTTTQRVVRSTTVAEFVKQTHDYTCQVCGTRLATPTGAYAEAAHIRALGRPHNGPDETSNVLCLCPNHHVLFDLGMIAVSASFIVLDLAGGRPLGSLRLLPTHTIAVEYVNYHRDHHERAHSRATTQAPPPTATSA
jgi:predicted restriction endonuclease